MFLGKPYSQDLRERVMTAVEEGLSPTVVAKLFQVSRAVIYKWRKHQQERGHLRPLEGYQKGHSHKIRDLQAFEQFAREHQGKTQKELAQEWPTEVSKYTVGRALRKLGYTREKKLSIPRER